MSLENEVANVSEEVLSAETEEVVVGEETETEVEGGEEPEETEEGEAEASEPEPETESEVEHKKTANDRIRELIDRSKKAEEELNDLKAKFEAEQRQKEAAQKPFYELDMPKLEADIAAMYDQIDELRLEGKPLEAAKIQRKITTLLEAVDQNEQAKQKWEEERKSKTTEEAKVTARLKEVEDAAVFYQKQLNIPDDVWDAGGLWLKAEFDKNPILGKKFAEMVDRQGAVASIEWAHQYIVQNMGKEAQAVKEKKEEAKKKIVGGTTTSTATGKVPNSFDALMKLSGSEIAALEKSNPKLFNKLINDKLRS